jgi:hypothetical protein
VCYSGVSMPGYGSHPPGSGRGWSPSTNGYLKITHRGPDRGKYLHRVVSQEALADAGRRWPEVRWEVHHQDFDKTHCCRENLVLLDKRLHSDVVLTGVNQQRRRRRQQDMMLVEMLIGGGRK